MSLYECRACGRRLRRTWHAQPRIFDCCAECGAIDPADQQPLFRTWLLIMMAIALTAALVVLGATVGLWVDRMLA